MPVGKLPYTLHGPLTLPELQAMFIRHGEFWYQAERDDGSYTPPRSTKHEKLTEASSMKFNIKSGPCNEARYPGEDPEKLVEAHIAIFRELLPDPA